MKQKRLPFADAEALDEQEEPTKRPRTRFVELAPSADDPGTVWLASRSRNVTWVHIFLATRAAGT
jgi:hypothetical protein